MLAHLCRGLLTVFAALALLPGCSQNKTAETLDDVNVDFKIEPNPPKVGKAATTIHITDKSGKPVKVKLLKLEGNMSHAGMKPVFADASEKEPGFYEATLDLTMGGDWFVLITGELADGRKLKKKIDVKNVESE